MQASVSTMEDRADPNYGFVEIGSAGETAVSTDRHYEALRGRTASIVGDIPSR